MDVKEQGNSVGASAVANGVAEAATPEKSPEQWEQEFREYARRVDLRIPFIANGYRHALEGWIANQKAKH